MMFETWLESQGISLKTFELRHPNVQAQMIEEYNKLANNNTQIRSNYGKIQRK